MVRVYAGNCLNFFIKYKKSFSPNIEKNEKNVDDADRELIVPFGLEAC